MTRVIRSKALRVLSPWLRQVHVKDARRTKIPGTWGTEVRGRLRRGGLARLFLRPLHELHFNVNLVIEREYGDQRVADIRLGARADGAAIAKLN